MTKSSTESTHIVVDRDGTFGDFATVWFSGSEASASKYAKKQKDVQILAAGGYEAGDHIHRESIRILRRVEAGYN